jgi:hypothetical protein
MMMPALTETLPLVVFVLEVDGQPILGRALGVTCLWSIWFGATMKRMQATPSLVDRFRLEDEFLSA